MQLPQQAIVDLTGYIVLMRLLRVSALIANRDIQAQILIAKYSRASAMAGWMIAMSA